MANIRSYNAFIKGARAKHGLSLAEARVLYRATSERLHRPAKGVDVSRHPRILAQEVKKAKGAPERERAARQRKIERTIEKVKRETPRPAPAKKRTFQSLDEYLEWFEEADDYVYEEAEGSCDYA
jgi:hypothetical protein